MKTRANSGWFLLLGMLIVLPLVAFAQETAQSAETLLGDPYPLDACPVSGGKLGEMGDPVIRIYEGREVRFCCSGCPPKFEADSEQYWRKIDEEIIVQQKERYPIRTCVVTGEPLDGAMGASVNFVYGNRLIRFCCKGCVAKFQADPAKFLKELDAVVISGQKAGYPLETCVVSDSPLSVNGSEPIDVVFANQLVRLCRPDCIKEFNNAPTKYISKLRDALPGSKMTAGSRCPMGGHANKPDGDAQMKCQH